jgi:hypothetical protein
VHPVSDVKAILKPREERIGESCTGWKTGENNQLI